MTQAPGKEGKVLDIRRMSKTFGGQAALKKVSLDVRYGEIHALVGENGSGKSTLIKCLAGYHQPDSGTEVTLAGKTLPQHYSPNEARRFGLSFMHQDLGLIPSLSVLENLALTDGFTTTRAKRIKWSVDESRARAMLAKTGHAIEPSALVRSLSKASQTLVAAARVLAEEGQRVIVFDEPTAALTPEEVPALFAAIRNAAAEGIGVVYVSHRLNEILELSDRVTVLRDGAKVCTRPTAELSEELLVAEILGPEKNALTEAHSHRAPRPVAATTSAPLLSVRGLGGPGIVDAGFDLMPGEILGIAGLLGSGRTELARLLFGLTEPTSGSIELNGKKINLKGPADAIRRGIAFVPENRLEEGIFPGLTVAENATILELKSFWSRLRLRRRKEDEFVESLISDFGVKPADPDKRIALLSGGNQQKVVVGKWIRRAPRVLILDEPMQGIDVGAKAEIIGIIDGVAAKGVGVILIDSDFDKLLEVSDRVVVLNQGRQVGTLERSTLTRASIVHAAYGVEEGISNEQ